jgi:hypothetical protein
MRTLALTAALVTALTGTGCIVSSTPPPVGDADVAWRFQNSDLRVAGNWTQQNTGCGVAAITDVRLTVWDAANRVMVDNYYPCVDGTGYPRAYLSNLPVGRYTYAAEAWRVDAPVFYDEYFFDVFANQATMEDATLPVLATAPFTVYYTQNGAPTCAGTPGMRFDLYTAGGVFLESTDPNPVACDPVSTGYTYQLDRATGVSYQVDVFALDGLNVGALSVNETCRQLVRHTGFPATINLLPAPQASCAP